MQNITPPPPPTAAPTAPSPSAQGGAAQGAALRATALRAAALSAAALRATALRGAALSAAALICASGALAAPPRVARLLAPREAEELNERLAPRVATVWRTPRLVKGARVAGGGVMAGAGVWLSPRYALTSSAWLEPAGFEQGVEVRVGCAPPPSSPRAGRPGEREELLATRSGEARAARVALALPREGLALLEVSAEGAGGCPAEGWEVEAREGLTALEPRAAALRALLGGLALRPSPEEREEQGAEEGGEQGTAQGAEESERAQARLLEGRILKRLGPIYPTRALYAATPSASRPARLVVEGRGAEALAFFWLTRAPLAPGLPLFDEEGRLVTLAAGGAEGPLLPLSARAALAARLAAEWGLR